MAIQGINSGIKLEIDGTPMNTLYERDLDMLDHNKMIERLMAIEVDNDADGKRGHFRLVAKIKDNDVLYIITNARHQPRHWVQLNTLMEFIRQKCSTFIVESQRAERPSLEIMAGSGFKKA
ncbi:MAG: hypothetical protein JKY40_10505 [Gammaproteobacteria bacterium]|nr:hypothetical protein [Gammaproteobacteria bacterium]MBL4729716.1 hypothetical protein [Gammaproteobacteria bacterium]